MKVALILSIMWGFIMSVPSVAQTMPADKHVWESNKTGTVTVVAFDTRGKFLGAPMVLMFQSEEHGNLAMKFHNGVADNIPFGTYRIEARLTAYYSEKRYVGVYQQHVTVVVGLTVGYEAPAIPLRLHGHVMGSLSKHTFVRLIGVFSSKSRESMVSPDGQFELAGISDGLYMLLVVNEDGILANRTISIPYTLPELEIRINNAEEEVPKWVPAKILGISYPREMRLARSEGDVTAKCSIRDDGSVGDVVILSGNPFLARYVKTNLLQWTFRRANSHDTSGGEVTLTYTFILRGICLDNHCKETEFWYEYPNHVIAIAEYISLMVKQGDDNQNQAPGNQLTR